MHKTKIFVSGSLAFDRIMNFDGYFKDHILPNQIHSLNVSFFVKTFRQSFGGTAGNIAYSLALLGEKPYILAAYGNDFTSYQKWCHRHGMDISQSLRVPHHPTASAYIITDRSDNQIAGFFAGAMHDSNGSIKHSLLRGDRLAIIAPGNAKDMRMYQRQYQMSGTPYIYDPGQQIPVLSTSELIRGIRHADVFISNDYELALILKKTKISLRTICVWGTAVVTTRGSRGSIIHVGSKKHLIPPAQPKNTSDPTGAGDAFRAGLIKGMILGLPWDSIGRLASTVSIYTVERYGTQTHSFSWSDIRRRYRSNYRITLE